MQFTIEKNIPIVKNETRSKYPFSQMEVGDSFFVPVDASKNNLIRLRTSFYATAKRFKVKVKPVILTAAQAKEKFGQDVAGVGVWRVERPEKPTVTVQTSTASSADNEPPQPAPEPVLVVDAACNKPGKKPKK